MSKNNREKICKTIICKTLLGVMLIFMLAAAVSGAGGNYLSLCMRAESESGIITNEYGFAGGDGSENSPFLIAEAKHLDNVRNYKYNEEAYQNDPDTFEGYHFKLAGDIDLSGYIEQNYPGGGWEPIAKNYFDGYGEEFFPFCGTFDGGGHTVSGLWTNRGDGLAGLFGAADASFYDLGIILGENGITGKKYAGGLAAFLIGGRSKENPNEIMRCRVAGNVSLNETEFAGFWDTPNACGGLVGSIENYSVISESYFSGILSNKDCETDTDGIGGITGSALNGEIRNCYAKAKIILDEDMPSCFAAGIAGKGAGVTVIENCYAVISSEKPVAPIMAGEDENDWFSPKLALTALSNYYNAGINLNTAAAASISITGLSEADMKKAASYAGWDFINVWDINEGKSTPELRCFLSKEYPKPLSPGLIALIAVCGALFTAAAVFGIFWFAVKKKTFADLGRGIKGLFIKEKTVIETQTVEVPVEVIKEVPIVKKPLPEDLSERERRVAELVLKGKSRREIVDELNISEGAVRTYTARIYVKAGVDGQKEFIARYLGGE